MQTGMYAISEMASLFNVSRQTLIYYDKIGLFKPAVVNEKGYRFYSPTQIPLMRLICMLRDLGLELDEIDRLTSTFDIGEMTDHLRSRVQALDEQIAGLKAERASVQERLSFYDEAVYWREREGKPELKQFERRYVVFEEFPSDIERGRSMLHPTLMRAILRMRALTGTRPMRGWGAAFRRPHRRCRFLCRVAAWCRGNTAERSCRAGGDWRRGAARGHVPVHESLGHAVRARGYPRHRGLHGQARAPAHRQCFRFLLPGHHELRRVSPRGLLLYPNPRRPQITCGEIVPK